MHVLPARRTRQDDLLVRPEPVLDDRHGGLVSKAPDESLRRRGHDLFGRGSDCVVRTCPRKLSRGRRRPYLSSLVNETFRWTDEDDCTVKRPSLPLDHTTDDEDVVGLCDLSQSVRGGTWQVDGSLVVVKVLLPALVRPSAYDSSKVLELGLQGSGGERSQGGLAFKQDLETDEKRMTHVASKTASSKRRRDQDREQRGEGRRAKEIGTHKASGNTISPDPSRSFASLTRRSSLMSVASRSYLWVAAWATDAMSFMSCSDGRWVVSEVSVGQQERGRGQVVPDLSLRRCPSRAADPHVAQAPKERPCRADSAVHSSKNTAVRRGRS